MTIEKRTREYLRYCFRKNAIPKESEFAELIESAVNQKDDGVTRLADGALNVKAAAKKPCPALAFSHADQASPSWVINLLVGDPAAGLKGFALTDGDGNTRLSIDQQSGKVSLGALTAAGAIDADGGLTVKAGHTLSADVVTASGSITANGGLQIPDGQSLSVKGSASIAGNLRMHRSMVTLGTPEATQAAAGEVVGALGFVGFGRSNGQLSYRAGSGFELVDRSGDIPSLAYAADSKPYADLKVGGLDVRGVHGDPTRPGTIECSGAKQFKIAHPTEPEASLVHASLDGPEIAVYYRGAGKLSNGRAEVHLPSYFEALTRSTDRTVMLTPQCGATDLISSLAATEITDGRFTVRAVDTKNPAQRFYWEVKARRKDLPELEVELRPPEPM